MTRVGPACSKRKCSDEMMSFVIGCFPWRMMGCLEAYEIPPFRTLPPTRTKPSESTNGCNTNRGLDSGARELFLRDSISREK